MRKRLAFTILLSLLSLVWLAPILVGQEQAPGPTSPITTVPGTVQPAAPGAPTQTAVAVTTVASPAAPQNPMDQVMWGLAMSMLLRYLTQKSWFSFLTPASTARVKAVWGFVVAAGTAAGIHLAVNGSPFDAHGASLTLSGLTFDAVKDVGWQWVSQQGWYELLKKNAT